MSETLPELWQFRLSMYPEKARWALDYKGIPHVRRSLLPGPHVPRLMPRFGQSTMPVLCDGASVIKDSSAVVDYLEKKHPEPPLLPADPALRAQVLELQTRFDEIGEHVRRAFFAEFLPHTAYAADVFSTGYPPLARRCYRLAFPAIRVAMRYTMNIRTQPVAASLELTRQALDEIAARRGAHGYLVGGQFTLADLAAATMLQPCANPPEYPLPYAPPYPPGVERWLARWREHPGTAWVRDMYRRHRGHSAATEDRNG